MGYIMGESPSELSVQMWLSYAVQSGAQKEKRRELDEELSENLTQVPVPQGLTPGEK